MPLFSQSESTNRLLNEVFLYVLEDFHTVTGQSLGELYTVTLETLNKTSDEKFSAYLISKIQGWFRHWATPRPDVAPAAAAASGGGGSAASTPGRQEAAPEYAASDDDQVVPEAGGAPAETTSPTLELERLPDKDRA